MTNLKIDSSITGIGSVSRQLTAATINQLIAQDPGAEVIERDLALAPIEHLTLPAFADESVVEEFLAADIVVIGAPMYNFGVASQLEGVDRPHRHCWQDVSLCPRP
ncbi:MAG: NAD(P)H-dependent oxidoreductase [Sphingomicrobium sp.]